MVRFTLLESLISYRVVHTITTGHMVLKVSFKIKTLVGVS